MRKIAVLFMFAATVGCGTAESTPMKADPSSFVDGFSPPAPGADEMQIVSPALGTFKPGDDKTICTYLDFTVAEDMDVLGFHMYQSKTGHHATLYRTVTKQPVGTHECKDADMFNVRFIAGGGEAAPDISVPDGLAFRVNAGSQLMMVTHWLNTTDKSYEVQAAATLRVAKPSAARQVSDLFVVAATQFTDPAGVVTDNKSTCVFKQDMQMWMLAGHAHEFTNRVTIDHVVGDTSTRVYDTPWQPEYTTNAPLTLFTKDQPFVVKAGESLTTTCTVDNMKGTTPITFPREMCTSLGFFFPSTTEALCTDGSWD
jgi:hypothetical protein